MPNLMKDLTPEHIMRFTGSVQELEKLDKAAAEIYANDIIKEKILNGEPAYTEDMEGLKQKAVDEYRKLSDSRFLKIKDAFYDDAEFEFDFIITNEQDDLQVKAQNLQVLMTTLINAAPTGALNDPRVKLTLSKFAEQLGISQAEFELADQQATDQQEQMLAQGTQLNGQPVPQPQINGQQ
jgi:hypothetical protein